MANKVGEVSLYYIKDKSIDTVKISNSKICYDFLKNVYDEKTVDYKESFYLLALNNSNEVVHYAKLSEGGITGCIVDVRMVFQTLLLKNSVNFIISHNHPSGSLIASQADKELTNKLKRGANLLDIKLLDHIIYTRDGYLSFADEGIL